MVSPTRSGEAMSAIQPATEPGPGPASDRRWRDSDLSVALAVFAVVLIVYLATAALGNHLGRQQMVYFDRLADAFLHGRLYLDNPASTHDLTLFKGHWYVPFPPLPALLLLPWVALFGLAQSNTAVFSIGIAAANCALVYLCLQVLAERGWTELRRRDNLWLSALLAFGTVHWYMAIDGQVWFLSQITAVTFVALACWLALRRASAWWVGAALAIAMLSRPTIGLTYPLLLAIGLQGFRPVRQGTNLRALAGWIGRSATPILIVVALMLAYNTARFGSALDFGYKTENVAGFLRDALARYGQFSLHFVPRNLQVMLLGLPYWQQQCRMLVPSIEGMSLFLTTPALVYVFRARLSRPVVTGAVVAWGLLLLPLITYYNTGSWQFGYRFSLDFILPVMVLLAVGSGSRVSWPLRVLILVSIAICAIGVVWWLHGWCAFPT
jgi:hypothetical protein